MLPKSKRVQFACVCVCVSGYLKKSGTNTTIDSSCVQSQTERTKVPPGLMIVTKLSDCYMFAVFILCVYSWEAWSRAEQQKV